jgi:hypothetical protein
MRLGFLGRLLRDERGGIGNRFAYPRRAPPSSGGLLPRSGLTQTEDFVSTPAAAPTNFPIVFSVPDGTAIDVIVTVLARSGADVFCQDYRARYERNGTPPVLLGAGVILGQNPLATGAIATAAATLVIVGNSIAVQVTGVPATVIDWSNVLEVQQVQ